MNKKLITKPSTLWIIGLVVFGIAIAWVNVYSLQQTKHVQKVLVPTREVPALTKIQEGDITTVEVAADLLPADVFTNPDDVLGKITGAALFPNLPIAKKALSEADSLRSLVAKFGDDYDGITIQLDQADLVPDNVNAGDTVDVVGIVGSGNVITSSMIAHNVPVLSVHREDRKILIAAPRSKSPELAKNLAVGKIRVFLSPEPFGHSDSTIPPADLTETTKK